METETQQHHSHHDNPRSQHPIQILSPCASQMTFSLPTFDFKAFTSQCEDYVGGLEDCGDIKNMIPVLVFMEI